MRIDDWKKRVTRLHLRRWFIISISILTLFISILFFLYHVFQSITLQAVAQLNKEFSTQVDTISSSVQETLSSFSMQVFYSSAATKLRMNPFLNQNARVLAIRELGSYTSSCVFADSIMVYNGKNDYIYTSSSKFVSAPADQYYDRETAQLFLQRKEEDRLHPIWRSLSADENASVKGCYSFMFFEQNEAGTAGDSAIMITIPYNWYESQLLGFDTTGSYVIMDSNGSLVAAKSEDRAVQAAVFWNRIHENIENDVNNSYLIGDGRGTDRMVCLYSRMKNSGWYFIRILTYDECLPGLVLLRNKALSILTVILLLIAGAFLAILFYVYFPFRKIVCALKRVQSKSELPPSIQTGASVSDQIDHLVESSLKMRQERELTALLSEKSGSLQIHQGIPMTLILTEYANSDKLRSFLAAAQPDALMTAISGMHAILLRKIEHAEEACTLCVKLSACFNCCCYYSTIFYATDQIFNHYNNLMELRNLHFLYPKQRIFFEKMLEYQKRESSFSEKDALSLVNALHAGNLQEANKIYSLIFDSIKNDRYSDICSAMSKLQRQMLEILRKLCPEFPAQSPMVDILSRIENYEKLHRYYKSLFQKIVELESGQKRQKMELVTQQIVQKIDTCFDDTMLSPKMIAQEIGMSSTYLGRMFRAIHGKAISDYINEVRIEYAKKLLTTTEQTVTDIIQAVGYENTKYFFVLFKRATGMTPLQYRESQADAGEPSPAP